MAKFILPVQIVSDGTPVGTKVTNQTTDAVIACTHISWELDLKDGEAKCTITVPFPGVELLAKAVITDGDES